MTKFHSNRTPKIEKHHIVLPKVGLTFSRAMMPQLGPKEALMKNLEKEGVKHHFTTVDTTKLKASQSEFNKDAILSLIHEPKEVKSTVVISNDYYILDGHHRVSANLTKRKHTKVLMIDMPILELIRLVKTFNNTYYKDVHTVREDIMKSVKSVIKESLRDTNFY